MMKVGIVCLLLLCMHASTACCAASGGSRRSMITRQGDALTKLIFNSRRTQTLAGTSTVDNFAMSISGLASRTYAQHGLKEADKITMLPGQPRGVDFRQYSGYVTVDERAGRALFYYLAEASGTGSSSMPLLLWLNGGPGCSSFIGLMEELGPFRVMSDGKTLYKNPYAWNKVANVLFLESPAGVGFSYSNTTSDYNKSGDYKTADDAYVFLVNWLERFPEYKDRDFYIAGESYAGHYVPQLAHGILHQNRASATTIHLKGIAIGNAVINDETDLKGMYDYFWTHALISDETIEAINLFCNFSPEITSSDKCRQAASDADDIVFGRELNPYNIYAPLCASDGVTLTPKRTSIENFDPCTDDYVTSYLNRVDVQQAMHANVTNLNHAWSTCSNVIQMWNGSDSTVLPLIKESIANGVRVLVYSGDIDGRIPVTSTRYSIKELKLQVKSRWSPWIVNNEVAGYSTDYNGNLTFATVRGAGHEVPSYQPLRALVMIKAFIESKSLV